MNLLPKNLRKHLKKIFHSNKQVEKVIIDTSGIHKRVIDSDYLVDEDNTVDSQKFISENYGIYTDSVSEDELEDGKTIKVDTIIPGRPPNLYPYFRLNRSGSDRMRYYELEGFDPESAKIEAEKEIFTIINKVESLSAGLWGHIEVSAAARTQISEDGKNWETVYIRTHGTNGIESWNAEEIAKAKTTELDKLAKILKNLGFTA